MDGISPANPLLRNTLLWLLPEEGFHYAQINLPAGVARMRPFSIPEVGK